MNNNIIGEPTSVEEGELKIPSEFKLEQNYPNPFNPATTISWQLPSACNVTITLHNSLGEQVETLVNEFMSAGSHSLTFVAKSTLPSGVYFYRINTGDNFQTKKMSLIK